MIGLEQEIIYGPRHSRRFGWDIGINLLSTGKKVCSFDCVYCQYGFNEAGGKEGNFVDPEVVVPEWKKKVEELVVAGIDIKHTTLSGNGEPTMHPQFPEIVRSLVACRNAHFPQMKLAVLTNGYRLHDSKIRQAISMLDEPVAKLDAATTEKMLVLNRPPSGFHISVYLEALRKVDGVIIQTMFVEGWNDSLTDLQKWLKALEYIHPREVQIYTLDRPAPLEGLMPVSERFLESVSHFASRVLSVPVNAYLNTKTVCDQT